MRGLIAVAALAAVAVLAHPSGSSAITSTAVGVSEHEWSVSLGRLKAPHGRITFYVTNYGQDDHNITIRRHGWQYGFSGRIPSGGHAGILPQVTVSLATMPSWRWPGMLQNTL